MRWYASAPSNIALIKYMGKIDEADNRPSNASLSYTLRHLNTHVEVEPKTVSEGGDSWEPLRLKALEEKVTELSAKGRERYLGHLARLKKHFNYQGAFTVRSVNDFPADCGLASSASSFAALTLCAYRAMTELTDLAATSSEDSFLSKEAATMSELSRLGSGSSCRSFFAPWSVWDADGARAIKLPQLDLIHVAVVVSDGRKEVSSSEAHRRVTSSTLFQGRTERAHSRMDDLVEAFQKEDWREAYELCWAEFWDMHALFETSRPSFGYMTEGTMRVLESVRQLWKSGDGPLCTMDAGPNVHLLFRPEQKGQASHYLGTIQQGQLGRAYTTHSSLKA